VVTRLDRLGRSLEHLIELACTLQQRQVDLVVLDQGVDTATAVGRMFVQILGAISELERALMAERTLDGLEAALARGRTGGQKGSFVLEAAAAAGRNPSSDPGSPGLRSRCTTSSVATASASTRRSDRR
jgi:DNA invertase Pin-like site-specific DNA recombinase